MNGILHPLHLEGIWKVFTKFAYSAEQMKDFIHKVLQYTHKESSLLLETCSYYRLHVDALEKFCIVYAKTVKNSLVLLEESRLFQVLH